MECPSRWSHASVCVGRHPYTSRDAYYFRHVSVSRSGPGGSPKPSRQTPSGRVMPVSWSWGIAHDSVVGAAGPGAAGAGAVTAQHLRGSPAVQLHQVTFGPATVEPGVAEMMPEPVRVHAHPALPAAADDHLVDPVRRHRPPVIDAQPQLRAPGLRMPGPGAQVPVEGARGLVADLDDPCLAVLAPDGDLPLPQIEIATLRILSVVADPGEFGQPDPGRPEHRDDRRVAALGERPPLAGALQFR